MDVSIPVDNETGGQGSRDDALPKLSVRTANPTYLYVRAVEGADGRRRPASLWGLVQVKALSRYGVLVAGPKPVAIPVADIHVDPYRFQFKRDVDGHGTTGALADAAWNPTLAGIMLVWWDPVDGLIYVVNGHHRLHLAQRHGIAAVWAMYINAANAVQARWMGALANLSEGHGTPIDAGTIFRDRHTTPADLQREGISLKGKLAEAGLALASLDEALWQDVLAERMTVSRGVVIGGAGLAPWEQRALSDLIVRRETSRRRLPDEVVLELIDQVNSAPTREKAELTLFGTDATTESLAVERAEMVAWVKRRLSAEERAFRSVASGKRALTLAPAGNVINVRENQRRARSAADMEMILSMRAYATGPISDALNAAAERVAGGEPEGQVRDRLYDQILEEIANELADLRPGDGRAPRAVADDEPAGGDGSVE